MGSLPMKKLMLVPLVVSVGLAGCVAAPPPVAPISVQLQGTSVEVQQYVEDTIMKGLGGAYRVESETDREVVFKSDCVNVPNMSSLKCAVILMGIGNSGWSGPYHYVKFRTNEIRGTVHLSVDAQWCAVNAFGKTNCMPEGSTKDANAMLRSLEENFHKAAQS